VISERNLLILCGLALIASILAVVFRAETLDLEAALLALAIMWVAGIPVIRYLRQLPEERPILPMEALVGAFYAVFFGLPVFFVHYLESKDLSGLEFYSLVTIDKVSIEALVLVLLGLVGMLSAWWLMRVFCSPSIPGLSFGFGTEDEGKRRALVWMAWGLALGHITYMLSPELQSLPSIGQFLRPAGFVAFSLFFLIPGKGRSIKWHRLAYFFLILPVWLGSMVASGFMTAMIYLMVLTVLLFMYRGVRLPWKSAIVISLLVIVVYPHMTEFRVTESGIWRGEKHLSAIEKTTKLVRLVISRTMETGLGTQKSDRPFTGLVRRISHILTFSHVVENTPEPIPYWKGTTYQTLLTGWVPRLIWRDKPEERWGNVFAHRYGILAPDIRPRERHMSINIPWITELYANFGRSGVLIGMAMIGMFLGLLETFFNRPQAELPVQAMGVGVLLPLFYQESNFTLMTGSLLPLIVSLWLYFHFGLKIGAVTGRKA